MKGALATSRASQRAGPAKPSRRPIKLMIVDDSMVARAVLSRMIDADGNFEIAGIAGTAEDAIEALGQVMVDIVLLDLEMPGVGGLKALPRILEAAKGAKVLIVSSLAEEGAEETVAALALGAADTLPKPGTGRFNGRFSEVLLGKLRELGYADRSSIVPLRPLRPPRPLAGANATSRCGCSRSAPRPAESMRSAPSLPRLPERIGVPILVTQHLPPAFMTVFARQLSLAAGREAVVAEDGTQPASRPDRRRAGRSASAGRRSQRQAGRAPAQDQGRRAAACPRSIRCWPRPARCLAPAALGIVLTGMGRDGAEGARRLVEAGGSVIAQDEASSAVWGMPRAIAEAGLACAILPPDKLARRVASRIEEASCK